MRKAKKQYLFRNPLFVGTIFIAAGLLLGGLQIFNTWHAQRLAARSPAAYISNDQENLSDPLISGVPVRIEIPSVSIDLNVIPGTYDPKTQNWTLSLNDAQWGSMTSPANNRGGLTFIYAHFRKDVFLNLPKIQPGGQAIVSTNSGHIFTYTYSGSRTTTPDDTRMFEYRGKPLLVLQTCTGVRFQNRQLFNFDLTKTE